VGEITLVEVKTRPKAVSLAKSRFLGEEDTKTFIVCQTNILTIINAWV
jgi:hypothetical protein